MVFLVGWWRISAEHSGLPRMICCTADIARPISPDAFSSRFPRATYNESRINTLALIDRTRFAIARTSFGSSRRRGEKSNRSWFPRGIGTPNPTVRSSSRSCMSGLDISPDQ